MDISEVCIDIVPEADEARFRALMQAHHYLGALRPVGGTVRYVARHRGRWLALAVFSAPALKCGARDRWIGWDRSLQFGRLHLVPDSSRFLVLPGAPRNLGSRVLSLCARRIVHDWPARFGHEVLLLETFVDPARFDGAVYRAAGWIGAGRTRGFARQGRGHLDNGRPKLVFLLPLSREARGRLRAFHLDPGLHRGVPRMTLSAEQMRTLPDFFRDIDDPRRRAGRRHPLPSVLALSTAAVPVGMRGYRAIWEWAGDLSPAALRRFRVRFRNGRHELPSEWVVRDVLVRVDPEQLDAALRAWQEAHGGGRGTALAIDGKTMRGAVDGEGRRTHVLGIVGHGSAAALGQRKTVLRPDDGGEVKRTNGTGVAVPLVDSLPDITGRVLTADAMLAQRRLARRIVERGGHCMFTGRDTRKTMRQDIQLLCDGMIRERAPDHVQEPGRPEHGRIERRSVWASSEPDGYLRFPGVGQVLAVHREVTQARTGGRRAGTAYGVTSLGPGAASPKRLPGLNRGHWRVEANHHILDWSFDEDRSRIRTGHGPGNTTLPRRFAIGLIKSRGLSVAGTMRSLGRDARRVPGFLKMTGNTRPRPSAAVATA